LENAQDLYELGDTIHGVNVTVKDPFRVNKVVKELAAKLGPQYEITTWMDESPLLMAVMVEKNLMLYILFFIVIVAAFGITCTLITFIVMKTREIGLLKAVGATNNQVMMVFLGQSLIVSVFGVAMGLGLGLFAVSYRNEFLMFMRRITHQDLLPASVYGLDRLPALVVPSDLVIICGGSLLICLLAAGFPARFASRMNLVEALRYE
jgi:lipoprotein-releasing system permease protein